MYKQFLDEQNNIAPWVVRTEDRLIIFLDANIPDYQQFKTDLKNGVQFSDANNNPMTAEQITAYLDTLP
jgi:hypothetical protein